MASRSSNESDDRQDSGAIPEQLAVAEVAVPSGSANGDCGLLSGRVWCADPAADDEVVARIRREFPLAIDVSDCLLKVLAGRGINDAKEMEAFFYPALEYLHDPFLLREMDVAVERMYQAARDGERVAVHGDFDVDGITGSALLFETISAVEVDGSRVLPEPAFIPDRATDGYGVSTRKIREWAGAGVTLLITVDTGTSAMAEIRLARDLGVDVIVLDHHIFDERPPATALVNPRRENATYPNRDLCGVAVAFKFAQGLKQGNPACLSDDFLASILDLVAMGLVADQMSLVGENRILVKKGLERFNDRHAIRSGVAALLAVAGLDRGFPVTTGDFAYQVAPRINACGRIGRVMSALGLLLAHDPVQAKLLAEEANRTNTRRKEQDQLLKEEAINMAYPFVEQGDLGLVLASSRWHKGIIGIGAARLVEKFHRPVILISIEGNEARGSARSVPNVDVKVLLDRCSEFLVRHGGHAQAAGMTLRTRDVEAFREAFLRELKERPPSGSVPESYDLDLDLTNMGAHDVAQLVDQLGYMEPFGSGNRKPVFRCTGLRLQRAPVYLSGGAHLRFAFKGPHRSPGVTPALSREFVSFGSGEAWRRMLGKRFAGGAGLLDQEWEILFQISRSTFRPRNGTYDPVQQLLVDIRPGKQ